MIKFILIFLADLEKKVKEEKAEEAIHKPKPLLKIGGDLYLGVYGIIIGLTGKYGRENQSG